MNLNEYKGVYVFIEQKSREIQNVSLELLGRGRGLADTLKEELVAVFLGYGIKDQCQDLISHGADRVIYVDDSRLDKYLTEPYAQALDTISKFEKPNIILIGATSTGRDLAPRVSARLSTGLTADCTSLEISEERELLMTRPAFGGNLMATIVCPDHRPQMSSVRPGVMQKLAVDTARTGEIVEFGVNFDDSKFKVRLIEEVKEAKQMVKIEDAHILVSGGRGVGTAENFKNLEKLADNIGATVSTSRAMVDAGVMSHDRQVGQTGKTVRPDIYFALGISGAIQHIAGMEESEYIIAINKDKGAPIFNTADLGIVGDVNKILPLLNNEISKLTEKKA
ncbi:MULTISPECIES: electron transfer flavoprotein subunit alpha/FixB family protein [Psychrilyobacter]|uniref:Electron transfer flavoprotein subunit alpha/FixB family protein n=1 Tax=Psychrilyobacter piezotolerans TaxID=2293438 RepID=A0ABX9KEU5_9FUSO|nr:MULTISPECIES: electron transfer flavoprotein subunit alpha/FixB family protein [Psychrilyobacter]MCS5422075.1 electron transfer flavoprotein subunit alpha/FixB family protein [Psychrilyobacter sp. S5]NDI78641.1 electron transfer flavoprotein subunit alpha/FixB family protein [Psychrilyobacter piezotolerans]RDE59992.1 electron transfer flavoprotein subunit alpha/FixB family protein [Psychrilyobacter sp. S5]REI40219.1 electron transfer flavoprotein subunit alpha/FixB family protein [Psychrilyo